MARSIRTRNLNHRIIFTKPSLHYLQLEQRSLCVVLVLEIQVPVIWRRGLGD